MKDSVLLILYLPSAVNEGFTWPFAGVGSAQVARIVNVENKI